MAKAVLKIKVTKEHIKKGIQGDDTACAIALAVQDALKLEYKRSPLLSALAGNPNVSVDTDKIEINHKVVKPSAKVAKFINDFDKTPDDEWDENENSIGVDGKTLVKPFTFDLKL